MTRRPNAFPGIAGTTGGEGHITDCSPRDEALLITRQRLKGLRMVSYPKFSINSENPFLGGQSLRVLGEK